MARPLGALDWLVIGALAILAAIVIYLLQPLVVVLLELVVLLLESPALLVLVPESDGGVYCATAGARLNAAAKSPKTSTSATAIGAFFIAKSMYK